MRRSAYSDIEICAVVREFQAGRPPQEICEAFGISSRTLFRWRSKFGDLKPFAVRALRDLEQENHRLKCEAARLSGAVPLSPRPLSSPTMTRSDLGPVGAPPNEPRVATVVGRYAALRLR